MTPKSKAKFSIMVKTMVGCFSPVSQGYAVFLHTCET